MEPLINTSCHRLLTIKGAPDIPINYYTHFVDDAGATQALTDHMRARVEDVKNQWSRQGTCHTSGAKCPVGGRSAISASSSSYETATLSHARSGLTLVGLVGNVDPPRDEIPEVIRTLRRAGIRIFMVILTNFFSYSSSTGC